LSKRSEDPLFCEVEAGKPGEKEEHIARKIVDTAYAVHKTLGPGLLEKVYSLILVPWWLNSYKE
jgi:hypothetical protein